jgi:hypothetical protein
MVTETELFESKNNNNKKIVNGNKKEKLITVKFILI